MTDETSRPERHSYYSARIGKTETQRGVDLPTFKRVFCGLFLRFERAGYFQEAFGRNAIGGIWVEGPIPDIDFHIQRRLHKKDLWPIPDQIEHYSEEDLFDVIELLSDHVSKGNGETSDFFLGRQFKSFGRARGVQDFQREINAILIDYDIGYKLTVDGEVRALPEAGMDALISDRVDHQDKANVGRRIEEAKKQFLKRGVTVEDRRTAVRHLADVLEYMKPETKSVLLRRDEADLFQLANEFGVRHHNQNQKTDYDEEIWLSWMFYYYLNTIHVCIRLLAKKQSQSSAQ